GKLTYKIYTSPCSTNQTLAGCINIPAFPPFPMTVWEGVELCVERMNSNYNELKKDLSTTENGCMNNLKQCGKIDSLDSFLCIDSNLNCPINKISILAVGSPKPSDYTYKELLLGNGKVLYSTN